MGAMGRGSRALTVPDLIKGKHRVIVRSWTHGSSQAQQCQGQTVLGELCSFDDTKATPCLGNVSFRPASGPESPARPEGCVSKRVLMRGVVSSDGAS